MVPGGLGASVAWGGDNRAVVRECGSVAAGVDLAAHSMVYIVRFPHFILFLRN